MYSIEIYKNREQNIKQLERLQQLTLEIILEDSPLKIGDKVERDRGIESEKGTEYFISSMHFDTDQYLITYGIRTNINDKIDRFSCINENELKRI